MKNRGFTLLELLGVIILLALLVVVVFPSVINTIKNENDKIDNFALELVSNAANIYIKNNPDNFKQFKYNNSQFVIDIEDLINDGNLPESIKLSDNKDIRDKCVEALYKNNKFVYTLKDKGTCNQITKLESICTLASDSPKAANEIGSKYQCKVKDDMEEGFEDGYFFYVLSTETDGTTNLILDRNVYYDEATNTRGLTDASHAGKVAWNESGDNTNGPVTAMDYLENATSTWTNLTKMTINTFDDDAEATHNMGKTYNVYARMPYKSEVNGAGCEDLSELTCPVWMVDYLHDAEYDYQQYPLNDEYGYWTFSSRAGTSYVAWSVYYGGSVLYDNVVDEYNFGVRPVINLKL